MGADSGTLAWASGGVGCPRTLLTPTPANSQSLSQAHSLMWKRRVAENMISKMPVTLAHLGAALAPASPRNPQQYSRPSSPLLNVLIRD